MALPLLSILLGIVVVFALGIGLCCYSFVNLAHFLNVTAPISARTLIIDGWIPDHAVKEAAQLLKTEAYEHVLIIGPMAWKGVYLGGYDSLSQVTALTLEKMGIEPARLVVLTYPQVKRYRTYASALKVKEWLQQQAVDSVNVFTFSAHARRSRLIYRYAFGSEIKVGIFAAAADDYELDRWWQTSAGFRHVVAEAIAYGYARIFDWRA